MNDILTSYERGVSRLLHLAGKGHPLYTRILLFQIRLKENVDKVRKFGDKETYKSDRMEIISGLIDLAMDLEERDFLELCEIKDASIIEESFKTNNTYIEKTIFSEISVPFHSEINVPSSHTILTKEQRGQLPIHIQKLLALEDLFETVGLRMFTEELITEIEADLRRTIINIRKLSREEIHQGEGDKLRAHLQNACDALNMALDTLEYRRTRTRQFYSHLRACQTHINTSIKIFSKLFNRL